MPTRAEKNHKISKKETVFRSARAKLPGMETPSFFPPWEGPFDIVSQVRENSLKVRVDVNRE